jgi:hypothetical protein
MNWAKDHFDHILLACLGVVGGGAAVWASAHGFEKAAEWLFMQAGGCVAALLMRMQGHRGGPSAPGPLAPA